MIWSVQVRGREAVRVKARSALEAVLQVLSPLGLRYAETKFTVVPVQPTQSVVNIGA